jgi:hypothetical protein
MFAPSQSCTNARRGVLRNLGEGGACLMADTPLPEGSPVNVSFFLGAHPHPVVVNARVVWVKEQGALCVMGLAFAPEEAGGQRLALARIAEHLKARSGASAGAP